MGKNFFVLFRFEGFYFQLINERSIDFITNKRRGKEKVKAKEREWKGEGEREREEGNRK